MKTKGLTRFLPGWLLVAAGVLAAGLVTFALGGTPGSGDVVARLDLRDAPTSQVRASVVFELPWGEADDAVWVAPDPERSTLEAVFPAPSGEIVLVDRPGWHEGSRVRWFDGEGGVVREHLAPVGSTLFASDGDGLLYVLAKSGRSNETAVVVGADGSIEATFAVPLGVNTGSIMRVDDEVVISGSSSTADLQGATLRVAEYLMAVTVDGRQATDTEAEESIVELWLHAPDGDVYGRDLVQEGFGNDPQMDLGVVRGEDRLQVPPRARLLGVDEESRVVGAIDTVPDALERRAAAGMPGDLPSTELFWGSLDGTLEAVVTLPPDGALAGARQRIAVAGDAVVVAMASPDGVRVVRLTVEDPAVTDVSETDDAERDDDRPRITVIAGPPPGDLNPYATSLHARRIGALLFRGLFRIGDDRMPVPDLCTEIPTIANGDVSPDGLEVTYRLRDDVVWHDDEPLTSDDVAFTLQAIADGELLDEPGADTGIIRDVRIEDELTVVITFAEPPGPAAWRIVPYVLPEHLLAGSEVLALDAFWRMPVGTGPYRVAAFTPGVEVSLDPVGQEDAAPVDVVFTADVQQARKAFDGAPRAVWLDAPVGPASEAESYDAVSSIEWARFEFNHRQGHSTAELAVRQALTLLAPTEGVLGPGPYGPAVESRTLDAAAAAAVLDAAGWRMGQDGIRRRDGEELSIHVVAPVLLTAEGDRIEALLLEWEAVGFAVRFTIPGGGLYGSYYEASAIRDDEWDVAWMELPVGVPAGWAFPYRSGHVPTWEHPWALNAGGVSGFDEVLEELAYARSPEDGEALAQNVASRLDELGTVAWEGAREAAVLSHGVSGVSAESVPTQALLGVPSWRAIVDEATDAEDGDGS